MNFDAILVASESRHPQLSRDIRRTIHLKLDFDFASRL